MTASPHAPAGSVRRINEALRGPVADVLARLVPAVAALPPSGRLDLILDDVDLLARCFVAFRTNLAQFRHLLVDARGRPVEDSETPLACGRSLDAIEAMVVRTAAKRHLRRGSRGPGHHRRAPMATPRPRGTAGIFARLRTLLAGRALKPVRPRSAADDLYDVLAPLLTRDWQLPLVPEYGRLSPALVRRLGPRLLDYRAPEDIRRLKVAPDRPPPPTSVELMEYLALGAFALPPVLPPAAAPKAAATRTGGGMAVAPQGDPAAPVADRRAPVDCLAGPAGTLRPEAFAPVLLDPAVRAALPPSPSVRPGAELALAGADMARRLVDGLDLDTTRLAVLLTAAAARLGERHFAAAFGNPGRPDYLDRIIARGRAAGIGANTPLEGIVTFVTGVFGAK